VSGALVSPETSRPRCSASGKWWLTRPVGRDAPSLRNVLREDCLFGPVVCGAAPPSPKIAMGGVCGRTLCPGKNASSKSGRAPVNSLFREYNNFSKGYRASQISIVPLSPFPSGFLYVEFGRCSNPPLPTCATRELDEVPHPATCGLAYASPRPAKKENMISSTQTVLRRGGG